MDCIEAGIKESIEVKEKLLSDKELLKRIKEAAEVISEALAKGGKVLFCGNGGSASDALHLSAELVGRFQKERKAMAALSLNENVATMTAIANDYGYEKVFARAVEGLMKPEDVFVGISTSGNSENVLKALEEAKRIGGKTIALTGKDGGAMKDMADIAIVVPSECTARIQEAHIMIGHIICELVEA